MPLQPETEQYVPYLRRHARMLTGSQRLGDEAVADPDLSNAEKHGLLAEWDSEMDGRLNAESEGMGISDPLSARKEARLADEAAHVKTALTKAAEAAQDPEH